MQKAKKAKAPTVVCRNTDGFAICQNRCGGCKYCHDKIIFKRTSTKCLRVVGRCLTEEQKAELTQTKAA